MKKLMQVSILGLLIILSFTSYASETKKVHTLGWEVAKALHEAGHNIELTIVGLQPPVESLPEYVRCLGFISKHTPKGNKIISQLLSESHFLFMPSRAEAYGCVFAEANAFGVPCLTSYVGGISTIVKDNINGMTFLLNAPVEMYCDYIINIMNDQQAYRPLALSSYNEFVTRLNWHSAADPDRRFITFYLRLGARSWYDFNFNATPLWKDVQVNMQIIDYLWGEVFRDIDITKGLGAFNKPVFLALGQFDFLVAPFYTWNSVRHQFNDLTVRIFEKSSHTPQLEEPEAFDYELLKWLKLLP